MFRGALLILTLLALALCAESADPACETGLLSGASCCPAACGICGGPKCGIRTRLAKTLCCKGTIQASPRNCRTSSPPCKITTPPGVVARSDTPDPSCESGLISRDVCCPAECSVCGGTDCKLRGSLIQSNCCVGSIKRREGNCTSTGAPCVMSQSQTVEPELAAVQENSLVETAAMPGMMTPETSDMSSKLTAMRLPSICRTKMRPIGGCFCYIVLERVVNIRKRDLFVRHCLDAFGTNAVLGMARKCDMYVHGPIAEMDISNLVHEVNLLIPKCYPPMTPLVTFKPVMYASGR